MYWFHEECRVSVGLQYGKNQAGRNWAASVKFAVLGNRVLFDLAVTSRY